MQVRIGHPKLAAATLWRAARASGLGWATWRRPGESTVWFLIGQVQTARGPISRGDAGYVIHPFDGDAAFRIQADGLFRSEDGGASFETVRAIDLPDGPELTLPEIGGAYERADDFTEAVQHAQRWMAEGLLQKVVLSRRLVRPLPDVAPETVWARLQNLYPHAFVSAAYLPDYGLWLGATPELLGKWDGRHFSTMALAGTRPLPASGRAEDTAWSPKEIEEQAFVTRYIIDQFKRIRLREYHEDGPRAVAAGPVVHLRTDFVVDAMATDRPDLMETMVDLLHPTSAVCGAPLLTARDFIRQYEAHDRALYAGYWGPVGIEGVSDLYVNLRCMRWGPKTLDLFVGAGITSSSQADQEWQETETKAQTLLRVLQ